MLSDRGRHWAPNVVACVPVRVASQAITMLEGSLGWLGSTASTAAASVQEKAKSVRETVTSEEFVDKAWSNVKSGVDVGGSVAASASNIAKSTTTKVSAIGKSAISTVCLDVAQACVRPTCAGLRVVPAGREGWLLDLRC
jgi:hypothetical protein